MDKNFVKKMKIASTIFLYVSLCAMSVSAEAYNNEGFGLIANVTEDAATLLQNPLVKLVVGIGVISIIMAIVGMIVLFMAKMGEMPIDFSRYFKR